MTKLLIQKLEQIENAFYLSSVQVRELAKKLQTEMTGLPGQGSLQMLPTFMQLPAGSETGTFLAVDFGGTNVRLQLVELLGRGQYAIKKQHSFRLKDPSGRYDFTARETTGEALFDFLAGQIASFMEGTFATSLGLTFSFPCRQLAANKAVLLHWTKEFQTSAVVGREIMGLLAGALADRGLAHLQPAALINDTTGTLLTAAYSNPHADIGSICGTGHNTCYFKTKEPAMIINMEAGNFKQFALTAYDRLLDSNSRRPGTQLLEKAVAGRYLGEICRLILLDMVEQGLLFRGSIPALVRQQQTIDTSELALLAADNSPSLLHIDRWLAARQNIHPTTLTDRQVLKKIALTVISRSARLVGATYIGILQQIDPGLQRRHVIGLDGSLFEKMPGYLSKVRAVLREVFNDKAQSILPVLTGNGSGIGAAIAAAVCADRQT
ncbi:hexokinase [Desulforamulus hydrothermalis]|uniref:Hexokinase n=1 Tax=Desulforamulus hydrothermalis Lam5 = DSM 18033 TaxID=1121428 RepID=K8DXJ8_9FIRM|nr:hexokinase [Desulforamulus hydrothermalis]CCO07367.1 Hexokinase [Desulforamulus hydrothermalis Lam5 = DSM 18033]SHG95028.1 hexokinase [Desulforamulus hydrothermalis Lam5 = DSM 18033]